MKTEVSRITKIEILAGKGNLDELKVLFETNPSQNEIDIALENAISYSQIKTAEYLLSIGGNLCANNYQGIYYSAQTNEIAGLEFAFKSGIDINVHNGLLINESIITAMNTKSTFLIEWLLDNGADTKLITDKSIKLAQKFGSKELNTILKNAI